MNAKYSEHSFLWAYYYNGVEEWWMAYLWDRIVFYIRWPEYAWQVGDNFQEAYAWQESYVYQGVED